MCGRRPASGDLIPNLYCLALQRVKLHETVHERERALRDEDTHTVLRLSPRARTEPGSCPSERPERRLQDVPLTLRRRRRVHRLLDVVQR